MSNTPNFVFLDSHADDDLITWYKGMGSEETNLTFDIWVFSDPHFDAYREGRIYDASISYRDERVIDLSENDDYRFPDNEGDPAVQLLNELDTHFGPAHEIRQQAWEAHIATMDQRTQTVIDALREAEPDLSDSSLLHSLKWSSRRGPQFVGHRGRTDLEIARDAYKAVSEQGRQHSFPLELPNDR